VFILNGATKEKVKGGVFPEIEINLFYKEKQLRLVAGRKARETEEKADSVNKVTSHTNEGEKVL